ncbi:hypothetical protein FRC19_008191 [Serendipita sp. 401]|nr:hypothetical protein FRC19_008191 [Serendipita sp. 401]
MSPCTPSVTTVLCSNTTMNGLDIDIPSPPPISSRRRTVGYIFFSIESNTAVAPLT